MHTFRFFNAFLPHNDQIAARFYNLFKLPSEIVDRSPELLKLWRERIRYRHDLEMLDDHMLRDIGLSRETALREAQKPFWRT